MRAPLKDLLGRVPVAATLYDLAKPSRPRTRYNLEQLAAHLPDAVSQTRSVAGNAPSGKHLLLFATLHYWIEQAAMVGLVLRGLGYEVTLAYLPYSSWDKEINAFDLRRQDLYTRRVLEPLGGLVRCRSLLDVRPAQTIPSSLEDAISINSDYDVMYSLQMEDVDRQSELYRLRSKRN